MNGSEPQQIIIETLRSYLKNKCDEILGYVSITGQRVIKIYLRALYRFYRSSEEYPRLSDVLNAALSSGKDPFKELGFELHIDTEEYIEASVDTLTRLCNEIRNYGVSNK